MEPGYLFLAGTVSACIGVFIGGARAHVLSKVIPPERMPLLEVGMRYQMIHSMAMLWSWLILHHADSRLPYYAGWLFLCGVLVFSGGMYAASFSGNRNLAKLAPAGGLLFLMGWICLAATWKSLV